MVPIMAAAGSSLGYVLVFSVFCSQMRPFFFPVSFFFFFSLSPHNVTDRV